MSINNYNCGMSHGEGRYANYFEVGYNAHEFVLDLGQSFSEHENGKNYRIITNPLCAKMLLKILSESVKQYEQHHGPIAKDGKELVNDTNADG